VQVSDADLHGRVVVVAGNDPVLGDVSRAAMAAGAAVGLVSSALDDSVAATVRFRVDPREPDPWWRIAMHIEQHLGPIDGVVTDASAHGTVFDVFEPDLRRRGRAPVIIAGPNDNPDVVLTALTGTPPTAPFPPAAAAPDQ
jgi:hypothetical protein